MRARLIGVFIAVSASAMLATALLIPETSRRGSDVAALDAALRARSDLRLPAYARLHDRLPNSAAVSNTFRSYAGDLGSTVQRQYDGPDGGTAHESAWVGYTSTNVFPGRFYSLEPKTRPWQALPDAEQAWMALDTEGIRQTQTVNGVSFRLLYADLPLPYVLQAHRYQAGLIIYASYDPPTNAPNPAWWGLEGGVLLACLIACAGTWFWLRPPSPSQIQLLQQLAIADERLSLCDDLVHEIELSSLPLPASVRDEYVAGLELRSEAAQQLGGDIGPAELERLHSILDEAISHLKAVLARLTQASANQSADGNVDAPDSPAGARHT